MTLIISKWGQVLEPDPDPEGGAVSALFNAHSIQRLRNFTRSGSLEFCGIGPPSRCRTFLQDTP